jgi:hypothetical protein
MKMVVRKRRTREHVIADLSVNFVERQALLCGYTVQRVIADYGYDLLLTTYNANGEVEIGDIRLQLKATDSLPTLKDGVTIPLRVQRSDLATWLPEFMPVILVVYDAQADEAYWLYIQRYFDRLTDFDLLVASSMVTVHIPKVNLLNTEAVRRISGYRDDAVVQISERIHRYEDS